MMMGSNNKVMRLVLKKSKKDKNPNTLSELKEHKPTFDIIRDSIKDGVITLTDYEIADLIRKNHEDEDKDYYTKLKKYVEKE